MQDALYENLRASFYRTLTGRVIHSLSNLVSGVYGMAQLAAATGKDEYSRKTVDVSVKNCKKIKSIIQRMAEYSGDLGAATTHADLREAIELVVALWSHDLEKYDVEIEVCVPARTIVRLSKGTLQEIFALLVYNGFQAMEGGGKICIGLSSPPGEPPGVSFLLPVSPPDGEETRKPAGHPSRPEEETSPPHGYWLLLKELVERHRGTFAVQGREEGTEVLVSLPGAC